MIGSAFIYERNLEKLKTDDLDKLYELMNVTMERTNSLDFAILLQGANIEWVSGDPIVYDPEGGLVIAKVNPEGLRYILEHADEFSPEYQGDLKKLSDFVTRYGYDDIYELSTF